MPQVFLGLGSNMGEKEKNIRKALALIAKVCIIQKKSHVYLTEPIGNIKQQWFLNCVVEIQTEIEPHALLALLKSIEQKLGRISTVENGPRSIDIDILFYGNRIIHSKNLTIPHPLIQERLFVLQPLMDIDPSFLHPVLKKTIKDIYTDKPWHDKVVFYK
ncbi:MAG: 2-amino-4-hydroxy-6-hydroxymethyldihydropteridine diphosphokinase [Candidatus Thermoplasmatota archaeon]|nr:2-amino-4-hydroxy-6-hydroxymethyldihydropteridine diphosphokinase [Candidatus Thermoplasmatota archaeon]